MHDCDFECDGRVKRSYVKVVTVVCNGLCVTVVCLGAENGLVHTHRACAADARPLATPLRLRANTAHTPRIKERANCDFVSWSTMGDIVKFGGSQPIEALAIHAVRNIEAGEELTLYYGDEYARDSSAVFTPGAISEA